MSEGRRDSALLWYILRWIRFQSLAMMVDLVGLLCTTNRRVLDFQTRLSPLDVVDIECERRQKDCRIDTPAHGCIRFLYYSY